MPVPGAEDRARLLAVRDEGNSPIGFLDMHLGHASHRAFR
jgi:hypothetical protein